MMKQTDILSECQKDFLFNSEYKHGYLNEDEKLLYLNCKKTNKGVGTYIGEISKEDYFVLTEDIFQLILSCCEDCSHRI